MVEEGASPAALSSHCSSVSSMTLICRVVAGHASEHRHQSKFDASQTSAWWMQEPSVKAHQGTKILICSACECHRDNKHRLSSSVHTAGGPVRHAPVPSVRLHAHTYGSHISRCSQSAYKQEHRARKFRVTDNMSTLLASETCKQRRSLPPTLYQMPHLKVSCTEGKHVRTLCHLTSDGHPL